MTQVAVSDKYGGSTYKTYVFKQENPATSPTGLAW
jgi:hypothetical protein